MRGILLSVALHVAVLAIIQASPGSRAPQIMVINARLQQASAPPAAVQPASSRTVAPTAPDLPPVEETKKTLPVESPPPLAAITPTLQAPIPQTHVPVRDNISISATAPVAPASTVPRIDTLSASSVAVAETSRGGPASALPSLPVGIDTNWYIARQVDNHPKAIGAIEPAYPDEARRRNLEGTLKLMLKIDDMGRVQAAEVVEATPVGIFDEAALAAFRAARFQPAIKDGRPVRYQAYIRVDFKLKD